MEFWVDEWFTVVMLRFGFELVCYGLKVMFSFW